MRYVSGTIDLGIMHSTSENLKLVGYIENGNGDGTYYRKITLATHFILL